MRVHCCVSACADPFRGGGTVGRMWEGGKRACARGGGGGSCAPPCPRAEGERRSRDGALTPWLGNWAAFCGLKEKKLNTLSP